MTRPAALALVAVVTVVAGGCGSATRRDAPEPPRLPRALAQAWARQADAVASALAVGDDCTARARATALQRGVIAAVNGHRVPTQLLEPLSSGVNDLASRIACTPAPAAVEDQGATDQGNGKGKGRGRDRGGAKQKHGRGGG